MGDVINYKVGTNILITHRVIEITREDGKPAFQTRGDANNTEDGGLVLSEQLVSSFVLNIPKGG